MENTEYKKPKLFKSSKEDKERILEELVKASEKGKQESKLTAVDLKRVVAIIDGTTIAEIDSIFRGRVDSTVYDHLIEKGQKYLDESKNDKLAMIEFVLSLDSDNGQILADYINKKANKGKAFGFTDEEQDFLYQ